MSAVAADHRQMADGGTGGTHQEAGEDEADSAYDKCLEFSPGKPDAKTVEPLRDRLDRGRRMHGEIRDPDAIEQTQEPRPQIGSPGNNSLGDHHASLPPDRKSVV